MKRKVIEVYNHRAMSFGATEAADVYALSAELIGADKLHVTANVMGAVVSYELPTPNTAWINNSLAILSAAYTMGLDVTKFAQYFSTLLLTDGRGRVCSIMYHGKHITLIDDAYNANPLSMKAALKTLAKYPGRKIAVIGDMRELGSFSEQYHIELGQLCKTLGIDKVLTCGEWMVYAFQQLSPEQKLGHMQEYSQVEAILKEAVQDGDIVMFKASNGVKLHIVVASILAV